MGVEAPHSLGEGGDDQPKNTNWLETDGVYSSVKTSKIVDKLKPGMYTVFQDSNGGLHAQEIEVESDELYELPNNKTQSVVSEIEDFWTKADKFKEAKVKHKRGVLLYGPPGTGKSSTIGLLTNSLIEKGGVVFYITSAPELFWYIDFAHDHLRQIEPERPVITVIEDIDKFMDEGSLESSVLNFLDGADSFDHNVTIATTNRLASLNDLILRPSRFDRQIEVDVPTLEVRQAFLLKKGLDSDEAAEWAKDTSGYSIAELKELFISVKLLDKDYREAKLTLKDQDSKVSKRTYNKKSNEIGFKSSR